MALSSGVTGEAEIDVLLAWPPLLQPACLARPVMNNLDLNLPPLQTAWQDMDHDCLKAARRCWNARGTSRCWIRASRRGRLKRRACWKLEALSTSAGWAGHANPALMW